VLNVADPDAPTAAGVSRAVAAACDSRLDVVGLPHDAPPELGYSPWASWPPFLLDTSAARSLPGYDPVPYLAAVRDEVRWLLSLSAADRQSLNADAYFADLFDYSLDDRALARYERKQA
jgi:hypothetical protein